MPPVSPYHVTTVTQGLSTVALCPQAAPGRAATCAKVSAMTNERRAVGAYGERLAERHLQDQGLVVLERNWRCGDGEIDLILRDGPAIVFCEVKTRRGDTYGTPAEAISPTKIKRLRRLAARWLTERHVRPREVRFDVVAVVAQPKGPARVEHLSAAF
jgi:putative endonuclease